MINFDAKPAERLIATHCLCPPDILLIAIFISGRWHWLPGLFFFLLPWLLRARTLQTINKNARGPTAGQSSHISTKYLKMKLDHDISFEEESQPAAPTAVGATAGGGGGV